MKVTLEGAKISWDGWYESGQLWYINTGGNKDIISNAGFLKTLKQSGYIVGPRKKKRVRVDDNYSVDSFQVKPPESLSSTTTQPSSRFVHTNPTHRTFIVSKLTRDYVESCLNNYDLYYRWALLIGKEPLSRTDFLAETSKILKTDVNNTTK